MRLGLYSLRPALLAEQRAIIEEFNSAACLDLETESHADYLSLLQSAARSPFDILLFDMEEDEDTENKLLRLVQTIPNCPLVLLSGSGRHAVFGYTLHAAGYLTTPLDQEEYLSLLTYLIREHIQYRDQFLPLKINGVWSQLDMRHITHVESAGHSLIFHLNDGRELKVLAGFKELGRHFELNPAFFRCHKSYVVNMHYVAGWSPTAFLLDSGDEINISRPYRRAARCIYACYTTKPQEPSHAVETAALAGAGRLA